MSGSPANTGEGLTFTSPLSVHTGWRKPSPEVEQALAGVVGGAGGSWVGLEYVRFSVGSGPSIGGPFDSGVQPASKVITHASVVQPSAVFLNRISA